MTQKRIRPTKTFSIAVLSYNRKDYLLLMMQSILSQTYSDFSVTVYDNASTDGSVDALNTIHDSRLRVVKNEENVGWIGNANQALTDCQSDYLLLTHDDDLLKPTLLEEYIKVIEDDESINLISCDADQIDKDGKITKNNYVSNTYLKANTIRSGLGGFAKDYVDGVNYICCPTAMLKIRTIRDGGLLFRPEVGSAADSYLWSEISFIPGGNYYIEKSLYLYRIHPFQETAYKRFKLMTELRYPYFKMLRSHDKGLARKWWRNSRAMVAGEWSGRHQDGPKVLLRDLFRKLARLNEFSYFDLQLVYGLSMQLFHKWQESRTRRIQKGIKLLKRWIKKYLRKAA